MAEFVRPNSEAERAVGKSREGRVLEIHIVMRLSGHAGAKPVLLAKGSRARAACLESGVGRALAQHAPHGGDAPARVRELAGNDPTPSLRRCSLTATTLFESATMSPCGLTVMTVLPAASC